jgi:hypothetical protein
MCPCGWRISFFDGFDVCLAGILVLMIVVLTTMVVVVGWPGIEPERRSLEEIASEPDDA